MGACPDTQVGVCLWGLKIGSYFLSASHAGEKRVGNPCGRFPGGFSDFGKRRDERRISTNMKPATKFGFCYFQGHQEWWRDIVHQIGSLKRANICEFEHISYVDWMNAVAFLVEIAMEASNGRSFTLKQKKLAECVDGMRDESAEPTPLPYSLNVCSFEKSSLDNIAIDQHTTPFAFLSEFGLLSDSGIDKLFQP